MKKRWMVLGLAALMSVGTFVACDKDDDGSDNGSAGSVSNEQWQTAIETIDTNKMVMDIEYKGKNMLGNLVESSSEKVVVNDNAIYCYDYSTWENDDGEWRRSLEESWLVAIDGVSYEYEKEVDFNTQTNSWGECEIDAWNKCSNASELSDGKYFYAMQVQAIDVYLKMGLSAFTYNAEKELYTMSLSVAEGMSSIIDVKFVDDKLYTIELNQTTSYQTEGEIISAESIMTFTFAEQAITLPDQAGLNAAVAAGQLGE